MKIKDKKTGKMVDVRLPKGFKTKWLKALRSGKYKQTEGYLNDENGYCCLGVACRINHPKVNLKDKPLINEFSFGKNLKNINVPKILIGSGEMDDEDYNKIVERLSTMNDNGKSFTVIANYIEKHL